MHAPRHRSHRVARVLTLLLAGVALSAAGPVQSSTAAGVTPAAISSLAASPAAFVPDWDGHTDDTVVSFRLLRRSHVIVRILNTKGRIVTSFDAGVLDAGVQETSWDGRDSTGRVLSPGRYRLRIDATPTTDPVSDSSNVPGSADSGPPVIAGARATIVTIRRPSVTITSVQVSRTALGKAKRSSSTQAHFTLSRSASVSAAIVDDAGHVIRSLTTGPRVAGTTALVWNGRTRTGTWAADGEYQLVVAATGGGRPTATRSIPLRIDREVPKLTLPTSVAASVAGSIVTIPLGVRASESGTVLVRMGRRSVRSTVAKGASSISISGTKLGIVATSKRRTVHVSVVLFDGAGNSISRAISVKVPPRTRVVNPPPNTDNDPSSPTAGTWPWPTTGIVTSEFGLRWGRRHEGIDIGTPTGTEIHPAIAGTVSFVGSYGGYGNLVIVDHGGGMTTRYGHMSRFGSFAVGSRVTHDDVIGYVGCTGSCTGPHLHFEVRVNDVARNPHAFLAAR